MLVGVDRTTDRAHPETRIVRLRDWEQVRRWLHERPGPAFPSSADPSLPPRERNLHRRVRLVYALPPGFRLRRSELEAELRRCPGPATEAEVLERVYARHAIETLHPEGG